MNVSGLKDLIQSAYENKKFLTNGQILPSIDFHEPVHFEVTALTGAGLVSEIQIEDDKVASCEHAYMRVHYLQMAPDCIFQETIIGLLQECPYTFPYLDGAVKIRISITGFTAVGKKPYRKKPLEVTGDPRRPIIHRRLQVEHAVHIRFDELESA
jgi:hypothetical protein